MPPDTAERRPRRKGGAPEATDGGFDVSITAGAALAWNEHGFSVVPAAGLDPRTGLLRDRANDTKQPWPGGPAWTRYQTERAAAGQIQRWFGLRGYDGFGIVCGQVSGNAEMTEFEGRAVAEGLLKAASDLMDAAGLGDLWRRLVTGYLERSPSGGLHLIYRVDGQPVPGNIKLAQRVARDDELTGDERRLAAEGRTVTRVLIETRGEGGYVIVAPSGGTVHPTGSPWQVVSGSPATVPVITTEERAELLRILASLDQMPRPEPARFTQPARSTGGWEIRPGDDYAERADWADILTGWTLVYTKGRERFWRRPGKDHGISATTGHTEADTLCVFSTSTVFDAWDHSSRTTYSKFGAYAILSHSGDQTAAAVALYQQGYGRKAETADSEARYGQQPGEDTPRDPAELAELARQAERRDIDTRKRQLRIDAEARAELAAASMPAMPAAISGAGFLAQPDEETAWRIEGVWPAGGSVLLAAQYKAGKTTFAANVIHSWCDNIPLLGAWKITRPAGPILVLDTEMSEATARRWLRAHGIANPAGFRYVSLRGRAAALNVLTTAGRRQWADAAAGCSAILLDCLGPVLGALGLDESQNSDVIRFFAGWDEMLAAAGITESFVNHHMGHNGEKARGASRLLDWPDAGWRLVRQDDDPASPRYFSAYGRDVDVPEARLTYDPATRTLTIGDGTRKEAQSAAVWEAIAGMLAATPWQSGNQIEIELGERHGRNLVRAELAERVRRRDLEVKAGPYRAKLYNLVRQFADVRQSAAANPPSSSPPPYRGANWRTEDPEDASSPPGEPVLGSCARCFKPCVKYGPGGSPLCDHCRNEASQ